MEPALLQSRTARFIHHVDLIEGEPLPPECRENPLRGDFAGSRGCHLESDWVLIYTPARIPHFTEVLRAVPI